MENWLRQCIGVWSGVWSGGQTGDVGDLSVSVQAVWTLRVVLLHSCSSRAGTALGAAQGGGTGDTNSTGQHPYQALQGSTRTPGGPGTGAPARLWTGA